MIRRSVCVCVCVCVSARVCRGCGRVEWRNLTGLPMFITQTKMESMVSCRLNAGRPRSTRRRFRPCRCPRPPRRKRGNSSVMQKNNKRRPASTSRRNCTRTNKVPAGPPPFWTCSRPRPPQTLRVGHAATLWPRTGSELVNNLIRIPLDLSRLDTVNKMLNCVAHHANTRKRWEQVVLSSTEPVYANTFGSPATFFSIWTRLLFFGRSFHLLSTMDAPEGTNTRVGASSTNLSVSRTKIKDYTVCQV